VPNDKIHINSIIPNHNPFVHNQPEKEILPQGTIVSTAQTSLKYAWNKMMVDLVPQHKPG